MDLKGAQWARDRARYIADGQPYSPLADIDSEDTRQI
jgi:hypothetical protein